MALPNELVCPRCGTMLKWHRAPDTQVGFADCQNGGGVSRRFTEFPPCQWRGSHVRIAKTRSGWGPAGWTDREGNEVPMDPGPPDDPEFNWQQLAADSWISWNSATLVWHGGRWCLQFWLPRTATSPRQQGPYEPLDLPEHRLDMRPFEVATQIIVERLRRAGLQ